MMQFRAISFAEACANIFLRIAELLNFDDPLVVIGSQMNFPREKRVGGNVFLLSKESNS